MSAVPLTPLPRDTSSAFTSVRVALLVILLLAFALRAWRLDFQSLWSDEGISLNRASMFLDEMLAAMPVEHAPGYFVALHGWRALTGEWDFGLRYLSLIPSLLVIALLFRLTVELASPHPAAPWIALLAAALAAVNAFQVWYAQEARMYAWLMAAALASCWALWRILHPSQRFLGFATLYAMSIAACVYLHYYGAFLAMAQAFFVAGWTLVTRRWRPALVWLCASAGALLLFLPWLPRALGVTSFAGWRAPGAVTSIPLDFARAYFSGPATPDGLEWVFWLALALAVLGLIWWIVRRPEAGWLLLVIVIMPLSAVMLLALRSPDFHERYTAYLAPFLLATVAAGTVALSPASWLAASSQGPARWTVVVAPAVVSLLLLGSSLASTVRQATDTAFHKPDFRAAAARIEQEQQPGDVILVDGPNPGLVFNHYYRGGLAVIDLRDLEGKDGDTVDVRLREVTGGAGRAWELLYFHPPAAIQVWLATHGWATDPTDHNGIRVTLYGLGDDAQTARRQNLDVGPALRLLSSTVAPERILAGDMVRVTTDWHTLAAPPDYKFSLRVMNASGVIVLSQDYVPQNWFAPTTAWVVDADARDQRGIHSSTTFAPGRYTVTLRVYDSATGVPVTTTSGDDIPLGEFEVLPG